MRRGDRAAVRLLHGVDRAFNPRQPYFNLDSLAGRVAKRAYELAPALWLETRSIGTGLVIAYAEDEEQLVSQLRSEFAGVPLEARRASISFRSLSEIEESIITMDDPEVMMVWKEVDDQFRGHVTVGLVDPNSQVGEALKATYGEHLRVIQAPSIEEL